MESNNSILKRLSKFCGSYRGTGINHDQEEFVGGFHLHPLLESMGVELVFEASGSDGEIFHSERSLIACDEKDVLHMWNLNSNSGMVQKHRLEQLDSHHFEFLFNYNGSINEFRQKIVLKLIENDQVEYHYYWGLPGEELAYRSGLTLEIEGRD